MLSFTTIQVTHNTKTDVAFSLLHSPLLRILGFRDNEVYTGRRGCGVWGVGYAHGKHLKQSQVK